MGSARRSLKWSAGLRTDVPELMITCPNTEETVGTGIRASVKSLEETDDYGGDMTYYIDKYNMLTSCAACGETHVWHADDAFFPEDAG